MDTEEEKKNCVSSRKRKASLTLAPKDAKIQRVEKATNVMVVRSKVGVTLKRRATMCPAAFKHEQKISMDIFKSGNNKDKTPLRFNNPLPSFEWADSFETWKAMVMKENEDIYKRSEKLFIRNPALQPRMRTILIDWLNEVCDVYKMQRKSLYLAIDFTDRFLSRANDIQKKSLQLIGVTALFIASKAEEIYPPKLSEFSFITDGACTASDILKQELELIQVLNWKITPVTPVCWVACFLQIIYSKSSSDFLITQFEQNLYVRICRLLDLCVLNSESLRFSYYMLAATAVSFYMRNKLMLLKVTAMSQEQLNECKEWMQPYYNVISGTSNVICASFSDISQNSAHNIQTHVVTLELLDAVQETSFSQQPAAKENKEPPPCSEVCEALSAAMNGVLTPPKSTETKQKANHLTNQTNQDSPTKEIPLESL